MRRTRLTALLGIGAGVALALSACGSSSSSEAPSPAASEPSADAVSTVCGTVDKAGTDELAKVCAAGKIVVSTDPAYPPQSELNKDTNEYEGFDIDVAKEIAARLGVTTDWIAPNWDVITAGGWNGRWDMSVGSMTVTEDRSKVLNFTPAYYFTPASVAVHKDNTTINDLTTDLDGTKVGACAGCTYDSFLNKTLVIPGYTFDFVVDDVQFVGYDTDTTAIADLALGDGNRLDAAMSSLTTLQGAIDSGSPIKIVGDPLFYEPLAVAFDKKVDSQSLTDAVSTIVEEMHSDGTLTELSKKWYDGVDFSVQQ
jgi:polar amino acid transport system substrate-binding protein